MLAMRPPSKRATSGYDIVIWIDDDGDIVAKAFTTLGHKALRKFVADYRNGDIVEIYCDPDQFMKSVEEDVSIGTYGPGGKIVLMGKIHLH